MSDSILFSGTESLNQFLEDFSISEFEFRKSMYTEDQLNLIYADFVERRPELNEIMKAMEADLKKCPKVHSSSARIKDSKHLIEKVIRKTSEKGCRISKEDYFNHIEDLIGIRLLYVFREDFSEIHDHIVSLYGDKIIEKRANIRKGDKTIVFEEKGLELRERNGYRSVHYVINTGNHICCEIQVRTLTEEAWGEMDHSIRYPYHKDDPKLTVFDDIMSNITGTLDDLSSFAYNYLVIKRAEKEGKTFGQVFTEFLAGKKD